MNKKQFYLGIFLAAILGGLVASLAPQLWKNEVPKDFESLEQKQSRRISNLANDSAFIVPEGLNFLYAAEAVTPGVVHIRSNYKGSARKGSGSLEDLFNDYFGERRRDNRKGNPGRSTGSGVIISEDGYIATNYHVIEEADEVLVTLEDNRVLNATVVGADPTTDLALLKVEAVNLPFIEFGNSDELHIGEWVLAVGNPFDLYSTVTAGIVSAKARNINIIRDRNNLQIESFIQTDAAVNPGNSGGALVNLKGQLVGINTAIATQTGTYAGYSFAVPVSLVKKVMEDLLEFGVVQRALLGISITDVNADLAREKKIKLLKGVYVMDIGSGSAAEEAGIEKGDVIVEINHQKIASTSQLQEIVALNRPGDIIQVALYRNGERMELNAKLKNVSGDFQVVEMAKSVVIEGAEFEEVSENLLKELKIKGGAQIIGMEDGKWMRAGIKEGFIITEIDKEKIEDTKQLAEVIRSKEGGILVEGIYPDGEVAYYGLGW